MSHFTVLVIGEDVERQLAPFHEFECTGRDDEYVQEIDKTEEARAKYETQMTRRLRAPDGSLHAPYEERFYRDPTPEEQESIRPAFGSGSANGISFHSQDWGDGLGYRTKVHFIPEGWQEVEVSVRRVLEFAEWVTDWYGWEHVPPGEEPDREGTHKYGWCRVDAAGDVVECVDRTNPNGHYDWYGIGGRWSGFFRLTENVFAGALGEPGTYERLLPWEERDRLQAERLVNRQVDQARKRDIDFEGMRDAAATEALDRYDRVHAVIAGREVQSWEDVRVRHEEDYKAARKEYWEQPVLRDLNESGDQELRFLLRIENYLVSREEFEARARRNAVQTFAVVKEGQWYEKGEMGWFGLATDEKDEETWSREFEALLDSLPDDTLLTVVDCHI